MASMSFFVIMAFFLLTLAVKAQQNQSNLIRLGSSLSPSTQPTSWLSPSGFFAFGFHRCAGGFAVGIWLVGERENITVWTANRDAPPLSSNATLEFTKSGRLLLQIEKDQEQLIANVKESAASASMLDSGNFVLFKDDSSVLWESFNFPTDTILGGQNLSHDNNYVLISSTSQSDHSSGRFLLEVLNNSGVVAHPVNTSATSVDSYWSFAMNDPPYDIYLSLNLSGFLCLASSQHKSCMAHCSHAPAGYKVIYRAVLNEGGILRLHSHHFKDKATPIMSIEWSALQNQCEVYGFCGFNSYCSNADSKIDCYCYPGFDFVDPEKKSMGCYKKSDEDDCRSRTDPLKLFTVTTLENVRWGDYPYFVKSMNKDSCSKSCLKDCHCAAALYKGGSCKKYKLPLRYGREDQNHSATAFFKKSLGGTGGSEDISPQFRNSSSPVLTESKQSLLLILGVSLGSIACLSSALAISSFFMYRHQVNRYRRLSVATNLWRTEELPLHSFSYGELENATDGFAEEVGRGSYGIVYKGTISKEKVVAVKRLDICSDDGERLREFQAEITTAGRTNHRNLVRLLGFCVKDSSRLLVYEYMTNGSLANLLLKAKRRLCWRERARIALDIAKGILYLHEECEGHIIHCNINLQNILLDDSWTAKISDFRFAKQLMPEQTETANTVKGIRGQLAPEWRQGRLISVKADVYSFGIVLLEIVCCRSNIDVNAPTADEIILSAWVCSCFIAGELYKLVGDENVDLKMVERLVKVALWCIQDDPGLRPLMKNVILMLEGTVDIPVPSMPTL